MAVLPHEGTFSIMYGTFRVPIGSGYRPGYLSRPDEAGRFPVVLAFPGLGGLKSYQKDLCRRLARRGFACLAIDLYPGQMEADQGIGPFDDGLAAYASQSDRVISSDIDEAHEFLESEDVFWAIPDRCGVLGIDVGGRFALIAAATRPWARAAVVISTPLTGDEDREYQVADLLNHVAVPVLGLYGAADPLIAPETVDAAQDRNRNGQWLLYDGAGHDLIDDASPEYDPAAAADAETRITQFFQATLPKPETVDLG
ncbi:MAG TPA: dienelactone hydrolase family protein [Acidimicrobiia bacterium]|nr:dienelactone hydrolase family protein [Acidimicrobiia bacterium]